MTRTNWGDRHLGHLPRRLMMHDKTSGGFLGYPFRFRRVLRPFKTELDSPRKASKRGGAAHVVFGQTPLD